MFWCLTMYTILDMALTPITKELQMNNATKYIIQFDRKGKYGIRVVTMSGIAMGYFCHMNDAVAWCEAN
jgi:hypothetical protein